MDKRKCHRDAEGLNDVDSDDDNYDDEETNDMRFHGLNETYALTLSLHMQIQGGYI